MTNSHAKESRPPRRCLGSLCGSAILVKPSAATSVFDKDRFARLAFGFLLLSLSGCGAGDGLTQVTGSVTLDGEPVTSGRIDFYPKRGRASYGQIDSEGRYVASTKESGDGIQPGSYTVTVTARATSGEIPKAMTIDEEIAFLDSGGSNASTAPPRPKKVDWLVPQVYSRRSSSGLTAEVDPSGGEINFDLVSDPRESARRK